MRIVFGIIFFLIAAFGVLLGVVYPIAAQNEQGYELARWQALSQADNGFMSFEMILPTNEEMILVHVEVSTPADPAEFERAGILTLTATRAGRTELAQVFTLDGVPPRAMDAPSSDRTYVLEAGALYFIGDEPYSFVFTQGEVDIPLASVELVLIGGTYEYDEAVPPIGYGLMAFGGLGLFMASRRRRDRKPKQPPQPKWGRG